MSKYIFVALLAVVLTVGHVNGHGRLLDPPQRSSMWRFPSEFPSAQANYNDNELFCGGAGVQHGQNGGRCGECGDPYHVSKPRPNEHTGQFGTGTITRTYRGGESVLVDVELTTSHKGYFEFKLCEHNFKSTSEEQSCFDQHPVRFSDGSLQYAIVGNSGHFYPTIVLPQVNCQQCVLQWTYTAGNTWGDCGNGTSASGCGPQETFRNCADIRIQ